MTADVERAFDELYGTSPDAFVRRRAELAKQRKAGGDKEGAKEIEAARKPTTTAWILNQLARKDPDAVAELVDAGRTLQRAQRKVMRGESADLKGAIAKQRAVVASLAERTASLMHELGVDPDAHLADVASALQAALVDPIAAARLESGRLEKAPELGGTGFPDVAGDASATDAAADHDDDSDHAAPARRPPPAAAPRRALKLVDGAASDARTERRQRMLADAKAELHDAKDALADIEAELKLASAELASAKTNAEALAQEATRLADEAEQAALKAQEAQAQADELEEKAQDLATDLDEARHAVDRAEKHVAALE